MKNRFDGLISKLNIGEKRISQLKEMSVTITKRKN